MTDLEHVAARPSWDCKNCGQPWPCGPARTQLKATHGRTALTLQMWVYFEAAAHEIPGALALDMFDRFLNWTWQQPAPNGNRPA